MDSSVEGSDISVEDIGSVCVEFLDNEHIEKRFLFDESLKYNKKYEFSSSCEEEVYSKENSIFPTSLEHLGLFSPPNISIFISVCSFEI